LNCGAGPVGAAALAGADDRVDRGEIRGEADEAVPGGVADEHVTAGQFDGLAGEAKRRVGGGRGDVRAAFGVEGAAGGVGLDEAADDRVEGLEVAFTGHRGHDVALGVDDGEGGPGAGGVGVPGLEVGVVEDGVLDAVAFDGRGEGLRVALVLELRGVDADDDEGVAVLRFEGSELVEDVEAIDAAEGPEVNDHDFAAQALEVEPLAAGVEPAAAFEPGGAHAGLGAGLVRGLRSRGARGVGAVGARCHRASVARSRWRGSSRRSSVHWTHIRRRAGGA
jgi:hypothetical protein